MARRVGEMREPPLGLDAVPDPFLDAFFDEIGSAPDTAALLVGLYEHAVPALHAALERHMADTNCLFDQPSRRICRFALLEVADMQAYGAQAVAALVAAERREELAGWERLLRDLLANAGGLDGTEEIRRAVPAGLSAVARSAKVGARRRRWATGRSRTAVLERRSHLRPCTATRRTVSRSLQHGRQCRGIPLRPGHARGTKTLMMFYKRLREIDVPEMMATIIAETTEQPWGYSST